MSLARAWTTKRAKTPSISSPIPSRTLTTKQSFPSGTIRHKISAPVQLVSTTNMLSYNAPDIYPSATTTTSPTSSADSDTDINTVPSLTHSPSGSTHDASSMSSAPSSPEPNHLSCYFPRNSGETSSHSSSPSTSDAPAIPMRALSHTKRTHEAVHRQRSISRLSSLSKRTESSHHSRTQHSLSDIFHGKVDNVSTGEPFGPELAKVNELAEEFGGITVAPLQIDTTVHILDPEELEMQERGLVKWGVNDYLEIIRPLFEETYGSTGGNAWI